MKLTRAETNSNCPAGKKKRKIKKKRMEKSFTIYKIEHSDKIIVLSAMEVNLNHFRKNGKTFRLGFSEVTA